MRWLWPRRRRAWIAGAAVMLVIAGGVVAATLAFGSGGAATNTHAAVPTSTAPVVRTDLASTQQANGTLGYAGSYSVVNQLASATTSSSSSSGGNGKGQSSSGSASASNSSGASATSGTFTALPAVGDIVSAGQSLYEIDGRPIPLLYGSVPLYRKLQTGAADGPDVEQLEQNLVDLGFGDANLVVDQTFTSGTTDAVKRWQAALGVTQDGVVNAGQAVFLPGPLRVTNVRVALGVPSQVGAVVLDGTSTVHVVSIALDVSLQHLVHPGDAVVVSMPDKTTTPGTVFSVSSVANPVASIGASGTTSGGSSSGGAAGGGGGGNSQPGANSSGAANSTQPATVAVTIVLANPDAAGRLDQAPVTVQITDQTAKGVLAVPVNALVALSDRGYAVNVVAGSHRKIVPVKLGLFAGDKVQVTGAGLSEGMRVEVPAS